MIVATENITALEAVARAVAPADLDGMPFYVVLSSKLPAAQRLADHTWGCAGTMLDLLLRDHLEESGVWRGRGPAIVLNDAAIATSVFGAVDDDDDLAAELIDQRLLGTGLHEFAHVLTDGIDLAEPHAAHVAASEGSLNRFCGGDKQPTRPNWQHGGEFIRACCHVLHRYDATGAERIPPGLLFDGPAYGLSRLEQYLGALELELATFDGAFSDLRDLRPPMEFIRVWRNDLKLIFSRAEEALALARAAIDGLELWS